MSNCTEVFQKVSILKSSQENIRGGASYLMKVNNCDGFSNEPFKIFQSNCSQVHFLATTYEKSCFYFLLKGATGGVL